jgi:hypothetical protein
MSFSLSHGPRLNARTTPRIHMATKVLVNRLCVDGYTFDGRILTVESLISTILKGFLDLPYESQKKFMDKVLPELTKECQETPQPGQ